MGIERIIMQIKNDIKEKIVIENSGLKEPAKIKTDHVFRQSLFEEELPQADGMDMSIIDALASPVFVYGIDGAFLAANKAFCDFFQINPEDIFIGSLNIKTFSKFKNENCRFYDENLLIDRETAKFHFSCTKENGDISWFEAFKKPLVWKSRDDTMLCVLSDVTESKMEKERLACLLAKEKEKSSTKALLISMISHELKSPLNVILSVSELNEMYSDTMCPKNKEKNLRMIKSSISRINSILCDISLLNKMGLKGKVPNMCDVNIKLFCEGIVEEAKESNKKNGDIFLEFHNASKTLIKADEKILRHVLLNILSNAIKYCGPEYIIYFDVFVKNDEITFKVKDNGIGISSADIPHIFNAFYRAGNSGNKCGSGLGLYIAKTFTELHGGSIAVQSEPGAGTTFSVAIPLP